MERFAFITLPALLCAAMFAPGQSPNMVAKAGSQPVAHPLQIVSSENADEIVLTNKYFVGGVKEVPGEVTQKFLTQCVDQKTKLCKWYQGLWCSPTLVCNDKPFWSKKKGYLKSP